MKNLKFTKRNNNLLKAGIIAAVWLPFLLLIYIPHNNAQKNSVQASDRLWPIQSVDTMKTSRDKAQSEMNNPAFDEEIRKEAQAVKNLGANYITIDTPYDEEFRPFLKRWIRIARESGLKIWFRGNWSGWEGWFNYPKNLSPEEHLAKTHEFITNNTDLFEDGDIFESCPECENAEHWKQPDGDPAFNEFLRKQTVSNSDAFKKINKKVTTSIASLIGGRAKESLEQKTLNANNRIAAIDHYVKSPENMIEYLNYFAKKNTRVVISEFGAPIPDINGSMNEDEQAQFIESIFEEFYKNRGNILGVNYYVSSGGSTPLLANDLSPKKAYEIVKNYYSPGIVKGKITNALGEPIPNVTVYTDSDVTITKSVTNEKGEYRFPIPPRSLVIRTGGGNYTEAHKFIDVPKSGSNVTIDFKLEPSSPDPVYEFKKYLHSVFGH